MASTSIAFWQRLAGLACACEGDGASNLRQVLELIGADNSAMVEDLFLAALSRYPTNDERRDLTERLAEAADRRAAVEDLLWALINHREFLFQH